MGHWVPSAGSVLSLRPNKYLRKGKGGRRKGKGMEGGKERGGGNLEWRNKGCEEGGRLRGRVDIP